MRYTDNQQNYMPGTRKCDSKSSDENEPVKKSKSNKKMLARPGAPDQDKKSKKAKVLANDNDKNVMEGLRDNVMEHHKLVGDNNDLNTDDIFRILDLYFYKEFYTYRHLHNSFDKFIDDAIPRFFTEVQHVFSEVITEERDIRHKFVFANIRPEPPKLTNGIDPMFPADARHLAMPYSMTIYADVTQVKEVIDINSTSANNKNVTQVGRTELNRPIMIVPAMVRSKYCNLNIYKEETRDECKYDPGGYFIVNGSEKVVICQDRMLHNEPMVFVKKSSNIAFHVVQVNSKAPDSNGMMQAMSIKMKKDNVMIAKIPILYEVNVMIIFRALGIESDKDIIEYCAYNKADHHMVELLRASLDSCVNDDTDNETKIQTQADAIDYLIGKMRVAKKYTESDQKTKLEQKKLHLMDLFRTNFLPHVEGSSSEPYREKAYYLGYMVNKLLNVQLGRVPVDNRDSYCKKRVDNIMELFEEIMIQQYKNNISECNKQFTARMGDEIDAAEPYNVIHQFKAGTFEQGFKASLMLGNWPRKKGVSQMLQRFSYMQLLSFLSRIDSQSGTQSASKLTKPRQLDPSSVPFLCVTGDTEVLLADGSSTVLIKDMENGNSVRTVYRESLNEISTPMTNYFSRMADDVIEIQTISGRKLKCTKDHPILIQQRGKYIMKNAGELKLGDRVIVRHMEKYLPLDKTVDVRIKPEDVKNPDHLDDLKTLRLIDRPIPQKTLEITARLIGASITDGHIHPRIGKGKKQKIQYAAEFYLGEEMDGFEVHDDIRNLGFGSSSIKKHQSVHINRDNGVHTIHNTWRVDKGGAFATYMVLMGGFVGKKTEQARSVPGWIVNGNNRIKREFLSGFNGGDGCRITMQSNQRENKLAMGGTCQTTMTKHLDRCVEYMTQIKDMYAEFDVKGKITIVDVTNESEKKRVFFSPEQSYDNIGMFADNIGYRYCNEKRRVSAPVIEYVKYKNLMSQQKRQDYVTIIDLYKREYTAKQIIKKTGIEECIVKRITINHRKGHVPKARQCDPNAMKYQEFKDKYYIDRLNLAMPIKSINQVEEQMVYDFTTILDTHTFIANSIACSNCIIQTPEHSKIGLIKHLSMIGSITIGDKDNTELVKEFIIKYPDFKRVYEIPLQDLKHHYKIFLNGEWLGVIHNRYNVGDKYIDNPVLRFYGDAKVKKLSGAFNSQMTSIALDHKDSEIRIYTDSGRLYRPVFRVNGDNEIMMTKELINKISLKATDIDKISDWEEFHTQAPYPVEFIDSHEQPYLMIAEDRAVLNIERKKIIDSENYKFKDDESKLINRYDDKFFLRYDCVEIHPSVLLGEIATNIPFCNRNQAPRNIFQYAQGRQGMGIYCTTYRSRTDISYVLYNPEVPVVNTRTSKYTYTDILPPGSNAVVAIATYSGLT
jgi:DNA-directed RNA polymerase beta subunit